MKALRSASYQRMERRMRRGYEIQDDVVGWNTVNAR